ncbi:hypothetical protein [Marinomonas mediterranea]|uniref:hypothetical protein n=1 Tax=Marinomonas mediterranea TaxID=119864 RepID=UPI00234BD804|nr:hypothetical protein [Marinomonas mediterranea]WCN07938.1 hypothetical protein GV055_02820 [Marinomonas mediterranea]WCN12033.1 hypothetical protein GV054_02830 [Marinomonas mediterranea]
MATTSFDKSFAVENEKACTKFLEAVSNPRTVYVKHKDLKAESSKGLKLLARRFSPSVKS